VTNDQKSLFRFVKVYNMRENVRPGIVNWENTWTLSIRMHAYIHTCIHTCMHSYMHMHIRRQDWARLGFTERIRVSRSWWRARSSLTSPHHRSSSTSLADTFLPPRLLLASIPPAFPLATPRTRGLRCCNAELVPLVATTMLPRIKPEPCRCAANRTSLRFLVSIAISTPLVRSPGFRRL
jgi:hypothetical protein